MSVESFPTTLLIPLMRRSIQQLLCCLLLLTIFGVDGPIDTRAQSAEVLVRADTVDAVVEVRGLACETCAQNMKRSLEAVEGIEAAHVDLDGQHALIRRSDGGALSTERLREAVTDAGYKFRNAVYEGNEQASGAVDQSG